MFALLAEAIRFPFPQNLDYPYGYTLLEQARRAGFDITQDQINTVIEDYYEMWKARYLILDRVDSNGQPYYRILHYESENDTVSEGQGYGMLIAVYMAGYDENAREIFDGLYRYVLLHLDLHGLMDWKIVPAVSYNSSASYASYMHYDPLSGDYVDDSSATDGDLDIAMALLLADAQWGSDGEFDYKSEALKWLERIKRYDFDDASNQALHGAYEANNGTVRLGDWWIEASANEAAANLTRSSDFMPAWFRIFYRVTGDEFWHNATEALYFWVSLIQNNYSNTTGLIPDFIDMYRFAPALPNSLETAYDGHYYYNACRDPWRLAYDYLWFGEQRAYGAIKKMLNFIITETGGDPHLVCDGYYLNGTVFGTNWGGTPALSFVVPFGVGGCVDSAYASWVANVFDYARGRSQSYYEDTLNLLGMLLMSGNAWHIFMEPTWSITGSPLKSYEAYVVYPSFASSDTQKGVNLVLAPYSRIKDICEGEPDSVALKVFSTEGKELYSLEVAPGDEESRIFIPMESFFEKSSLYFFVLEAWVGSRKVSLKGRGKVFVK